MAVTMEEIAQAIVADGKGMLAADETVHDTDQAAGGAEHRVDRRTAVATTGRCSSPRRASPSSSAASSCRTRPSVRAARRAFRWSTCWPGRGIIPGIKVDDGAKRLAGSLGEFITEGLDGLRQRLEEYRTLGARFAKWRAVIAIDDDGLPTERCVQANAHALARYAALCQEQGLVPIVEPEVLMDGAHTLERCEEVTERVLQAVFDALFDQRVALEGMLLKPNMVIAGQDCARQASVEEVATATLAHAGAACAARGPRHRLPLGRTGPAAGDPAPQRHQPAGRPEAVEAQLFLRSRAAGRGARGLAGQTARTCVAGQRAFYHRAQCDSAAALGQLWQRHGEQRTGLRLSAVVAHGTRTHNMLTGGVSWHTQQG